MKNHAHIKGGPNINRNSRNRHNRSFFQPIIIGKIWLVIVKNNSQDDSWFMNDDKRDGFNDDNEYLFSDLANVEGSGVNRINFYSNGFQTMTADKSHNASGNNYIYLAWGQPIVAGTNIPNNAR